MELERREKLKKKIKNELDKQLIEKDRKKMRERNDEEAYVDLTVH